MSTGKYSSMAAFEAAIADDPEVLGAVYDGSRGYDGCLLRLGYQSLGAESVAAEGSHKLLNSLNCIFILSSPPVRKPTHDETPPNLASRTYCSGVDGDLD
jgi:hypothetical protein